MYFWTVWRLSTARYISYVEPRSRVRQSSKPKNTALRARGQGRDSLLGFPLTLPLATCTCPSCLLHSLGRSSSAPLATALTASLHPTASRSLVATSILAVSSSSLPVSNSRTESRFSLYATSSVPNPTCNRLYGQSLYLQRVLSPSPNSHAPQPLRH